MTVLLVRVLLFVAALYILCGLLFAPAFVTRGVHRIDENAAGATTGFRIIIIPATIVFWPFLLKKWIRAVKKTTND